MRTGLNTRLTQNLGITPKLTQSLRVLAMTQMELDQFVEEALINNPLLELKHEDPKDETEMESRPKAPDVPGHELYSIKEHWGYEGNRFNNGGATEVIEATVEATVSLSERLDQQLMLLPLSDDERKIATAIIQSLDEDGLLRCDEREIASQLGVDSNEVRRILESYVQQLDPPGIGARSLLECFLLQLDGTDVLDQYARKLLCESPFLLEEDDGTIAKALGIDLPGVTRLRARLRRLDPYPGHDIHSDAIFVRPDIVFRKGPDGSINIDILDRYSQRIAYHNPWKGTRWKNVEEKAFMQEAVQEAKWLISALNQRMKTMLKVAEFLASHQKEFILHGPLRLKPLTLMEVAKETEMHESTISRAVAGKYVQTPMGVMPLKSFFSAGLPTRTGELISIRSVQESIKMLIACEPKDRPISDQAISEHLKRQGIKIARRTVAKYREAMGILPTSKRRERGAKIKNAA